MPEILSPGWGLEPYGETPWGGTENPFVYGTVPVLVSGVCVDEGLREDAELTFVMGWQ